MKIFLVLLTLLFTACAPDAQVIDNPIVKKLDEGQRSGTQSFDHSAWSALLKAASRPNEGRVDYAYLAQHRAELDAYLDSLAKADVAKLGRAEQFALLLNAYNANTVRLILENYPAVKSIRDLSDPWKTARYTVAGSVLSLDDIEHGLLRPIFKDPRIHFGVNCASIGCPPLADFAFTGPNVESQLDAVTRIALTNPRYARVNGDTLELTAILDWYGKDFVDETFVGSAKTVPVWVARFASEDVKKLVKAKGGAPNVVFKDYDWKLNDVAR
ncbi:MAG: DUF547 domain-containing protein [bacterium]